MTQAADAADTENNGDSVEILLIGLLLITGLTFGTLGSYFFHLPRVVDYIIAGIMFAPDFLGGPLGIESAEWTLPMVAVALGIVAYLIGGAVTVTQLRQLGWVIVTATLGKVGGSFLAVLGGFLLLGMVVPDLANSSLALLLAAIATTTAPAELLWRLFTNTALAVRSLPLYWAWWPLMMLSR